jgi:DNA-binding MarR family transcriptional regulator
MQAYSGWYAASVPADLETLGRAVKQLQYRHHRALDAGLAAVGTTLAQWDALRAIGRTPGESAHALAVETFQSDQSFGTLANRLAAQDLITRRAGRGRRIEHLLTPAGRKMLRVGHPIANAVFATSFAGLSEAERSRLLDLLLRILRGHDDKPLVTAKARRDGYGRIERR